jgi:uncharacterized membrane protein
MLQALGRLHPFLVHFPVALLLAALVAELPRRRDAGPSAAGFHCLTLGVLGAGAAALSGWLFAAHDPPGTPALLERHRWLGLGSAVAAAAAWLLARRWRGRAEARLAWPTRAALVLACGLALATGALGGEMVYGEGFILEPLRRSRSARPGPAPDDGQEAALEGLPVLTQPAPAIGSSGATPLLVTGSPPIDYLREIQPLLERRCYECHGAKKRPKGNLRLSDLASVFARDPSEAALVPGEPERSLVYRRLVLPAEDEERMPPEGDPLPAAEIELVRRWIAEGARWVEASPVNAPGAGLELSEAQRATRDAALSRLRARAVRAQRIAAASEEVEVDFALASEACGDEELALLAGLEPCLVELSLARSRVSDAGLARLADFRALRRLRLEHTEVGDAGLVYLVGLPALESLNLFATEVSAGALSVLAGLRPGARIYVGETALDDEALDELARRRPDLVLVRGRLAH